MQLHTMWTPKCSNLQLVKNDNIQRKYFKIVYDSLVIIFFYSNKYQILPFQCHNEIQFSIQGEGESTET